DENDPGQQRRNQKPIVPELRNHTGDDDDECACGTANLDPAPTEQRNQEAADYGGDQTRLWGGPGCDRNSNAERQRYESDGDPGQCIASEQAPGIAFEGRKELRFHWVRLGVEVSTCIVLHSTGA